MKGVLLNNNNNVFDSYHAYSNALLQNNEQCIYFSKLQYCVECTIRCFMKHLVTIKQMLEYIFYERYTMHRNVVEA